MTVRQVLNGAQLRLTAAGLEDDRAARVLLEEALGVSPTGLITALTQEMDSGRLTTFEAMVERAARNEPVQYIIGKWDFYGRTFKTDRRALVPRPETELLAEAALAAMPTGAGLRVLDAGCGTGCIGISIKLERPAARVTLIDISGEALALAGENAALLGAEVELVAADMRLKLPGGPYDIIVSNPPYINAADMAELAPVVRDHEPRLALFGGEDGLDFIRALADRAGDSLQANGAMFIEVGYDQAAVAIKLLKQAGVDADALPDYSGVLRVIAARKGS
jgi:release factor glutamine methyltransferase